MDLKTCSRCQTDLPVREFYKKQGRPDGIMAYCKTCYKAALGVGSNVRGYQKVTRTDTHKSCSSCREMLPFSAFQKEKKSIDGYYAYCRLCKRGKVYGITHQRMKELHDVSGGNCAICGTSPALVVDHCHESEKVRGLLCRPCNLVLGFAKDNPDLLRRAADYLLTH